MIIVTGGFSKKTFFYYFQKQPYADILQKKLQYSQENICVGVTFL